jgi:hypothetical protein
MYKLSTECLVNSEVVDLLVRTGYPRDSAQPAGEGRYRVMLSDAIVADIHDAAFPRESFCDAFSRLLTERLGGFH